jgi:hypothetical protein
MKQMSQVYTPEYLKKYLEVPDEILPFVQATPRLLPGETEDDFYRLFEMMASELGPDTDLEWLCTIDLTWLWFDITRYRRWKNAIIITGRRAALEFALAKTSPGAQLVGGMNPMIRAQARMDAEALQLEPNKHNSLSARLEAHGYDADAVNASAFVQGLEALATIEKFLASARHQVAVIVRDVGLRHEFTRRAWALARREAAEMKLLEQNDVQSQPKEQKKETE